MKSIDRLKDPTIAAARKALAPSGDQAPAAFALDGAKLVDQALKSSLRIDRVFLLEDQPTVG